MPKDEILDGSTWTDVQPQKEEILDGSTWTEVKKKRRSGTKIREWIRSYNIFKWTIKIKINVSIAGL